MIADPVFDDPTRLARFDTSLTMEDRYASSHQGRVLAGRRERWGVRDIVSLLYMPVYTNFCLLHGAIIESEECVYDIHSIGDRHRWL